MMKKMIKRLLIFALAALLLMSTALTASAAEEVGTGGVSYAGPGTNTFAQKLDLADIYIDPAKIRQVKVEPVKVSGSVETGHKGTWQNTDIPECTMSLDATKLMGSSSNKVSAEWYYIYPQAAVLPDGTVKDLRITYKLKRVETSGPANTQLIDGWVLMSNGGPSDYGHNVRGGVCDSVNTSQLPWACQSEMDISISVAGGSGSFLVSLNGDNQWQNQGYESWIALENRGTNKEYTRETVILPNENYYYPKENETDKDGKTIYGGKTGVQGAVGQDRNYNSGFVTMGSNNYTMTVKEIGAIDKNGNSQNQNIYLTLGDLQHRIWSGSGPNGKIATGRDGKGTKLPGGSFTGEITAIKGDETTLRRYTVPDCKTGVTYTMTPDKGYTIDTVSVDDTLFTLPDDPATGTTWTTELPSDDGGGVLKYEGNGVFSYSFGNANTKDHSIYVSWKKGKEDPTTTTTTRPTQTTTASDTTKESDDSDSKHGKSTSTGDRFMPLMIGGIMLLAAVVIIFTLIHRRRQDS